RRAAYRVEAPRGITLLSAGKNDWLKAWPDNHSTNFVELGSRVVLQLKPPGDVRGRLQGRPLRIVRQVSPDTFVLQAPDAWTAIQQAQQLAQMPDVEASCPVMRRRLWRHSPYAPRPNDPYFLYQWNMENRDTNGSVAGVDLNVRAAWPIARGDGVVIAIGDDGVDLTHPDLAARGRSDLHYNFATGETNGLHPSTLQMHGTAVTGLAVADGYNHLGMIGVAYRAQFASWVIFDSTDNLVSDEALAQMFEYQSNVVDVQNHSWGNADVTQLDASLLEKIAISNAVLNGRGGRGVVIVRSGGNGRGDGINVNDDGYASDPKAIGVGAVRVDGRVTSYSNPGASLLVAAPSGDIADGYPTLFTTDRQGSLGYNAVTFTNDLADYAFNAVGFSGTSGSAPQIAGVAALILSANPNLTYRDVQQILIHSGRQVDQGDPDIMTNGAGFRVSHNVGFGVPDAGFAVRLARNWINRPPLTNLLVTSTNTQPIPDDGLRLLISGTGVPDNLASIHTLPSFGPHADTPTAILPLVDLGMVTNPITTDLTGKGAFIQRGISFFSDKIKWAAKAGAAFAVIYDNVDGTNLVLMGATDFTPIPAVFIDQNDGDALHNLLLTNSEVRGQIHLDNASYSFTVTNTLLCEHVGVRVATDHTRRADVRITLLSPQGTRSVLQQLNTDQSPGPVDWTYYSTHHFYESSAGAWTVFVSDEDQGATGSVQLVSLSLEGVPITDTDHDGLDDNWETAHFHTLAFGPQDDPDGDGFNNMREQILGTDPNAADAPLQLDLSLWNDRLARLGWPSSTNWSYAILTSTNAAGPMAVLTNLTGHFPDTEWFVPYQTPSNQFFQVRAVRSQ
ncbi:MAG: S8 family serine peptidase, partial [Limisphaerales bacterium]